MGKRILVVGGGGREHAILWKLAQSSGVEKLFAAPGNGGTRQIAENVRIAVDGVVGLTGFAVKNNIDLTIVGPEKPLSLGIVDVFRSCGQPIFGPTRKASEIETSKAPCGVRRGVCRNPNSPRATGMTSGTPTWRRASKP